MPRHDEPSFHLRLPPDLRKRVKLASVENERSMTEEIIARLETSFDLVPGDRMKLAELLAEAQEIVEKGSR